MEGNARTWFTPRQKAELWERWKSRQCVADIARALERRNKSGVYRVLTLNGGIAPAPRRRASVALRLEEREETSRGVAAGRSIRLIAQGLRRSPSTVSREIRRNGGCSTYRASEAETRAWQRALGNREALVVSHLLAAIPGQGAAQFLRQFAHVFSERGDECGRVLAWDLEKPLDERRDVRVIRSTEKVSFLVAGHSAVLDLSRPLADGNGIDDLSLLRCATLGLAHLPCCTQVRQ
jgi:hypothetical protein